MAACQGARCVACPVSLRSFAMAFPDASSWQVVYDLRRQLPENWWTPILPLAMAFVLVRVAARQPSKAVRIVMPLIAGIAVLLAIAFAAGTWYVNAGLRAAFDRGEVRWVEGVVADFVAQPTYVKT